MVLPFCSALAVYMLCQEMLHQNIEQIGYRYHGLEIYMILNGMCPVFAVLTKSNLEVRQHTRDFCKPWLNQTDFPCFCFVHYKRFVISERNAI